MSNTDNTINLSYRMLIFPCRTTSAVRVRRGNSVALYKWRLTVKHAEPYRRTELKSVIMGNVIAASAPPPPPPPPPSHGLMPNLGGKQDPSASMYAPAEVSTQVENPGTIEDLHKKCKGTSLECLSRVRTIPALVPRLSRFSILSQKNCW